MNELAILHVPESKFCFPADDKTVSLRLRVSRLDKPKSISVVYGGKYEYAFSQKEAEMELVFTDRLFSWHAASIELSDVRFVYVFKIIEGENVFYYSEDGLSDSYDFTLAYYNSFQLPYINGADVHRVVPWMREAVFYQIFIDRFHRADAFKDDSYINMKWLGKPTPKSFAGGDIPGIAEKLPYLAGLGVNTIYLTPIFTSASNHKYDISDYYSIDRQFGSNEDFRNLMEKAHERGMRIVLDAVFNHCSENLRQFQDVLKNGRASKYHGWFMIDGDRPDAAARNYECFSACAYMPKFNTSNKEVQEYLLGIATFWIKEYDIDGWRLDVSDELSHDFWRKFRFAVKEAKPDAVIIGENWHDANPSLHGDQFDGIMNYAFTKASLDFFANESIDAGQFAEKLSGLLMRNTDQANLMMLNILDSHDTHRFLTCVGENRDKLLAALAVEFMFVGAPGIYYGTEIGMIGGYDPDSRRCFDWNGEGGAIADAISSLIALRKRRELKFGGIKIAHERGSLIITRDFDGGAVLLQVNASKESEDLLIPGNPLVENGLLAGKIKPWGFAVNSTVI
ncbi:MAG: glycoside hydrolase family 13 protein [Clostridiales bacterium]|jgi:glycosidase|nr:glycoside hydrolase family 13 protein [Clostridiales bacterium]